MPTFLSFSFLLSADFFSYFIIFFIVPREATIYITTLNVSPYKPAPSMNCTPSMALSTSASGTLTSTARPACVMSVRAIRTGTPYPPSIHENVRIEKPSQIHQSRHAW